MNKKKDKYDYVGVKTKILVALVLINIFQFLVVVGNSSKTFSLETRIISLEDKIIDYVILSRDQPCWIGNITNGISRHFYGEMNVSSLHQGVLFLPDSILPRCFTYDHPIIKSFK